MKLGWELISFDIVNGFIKLDEANYITFLFFSKSLWYHVRMKKNSTIPVLYEDDTLLAINKPAGKVSVPDPNNPIEQSVMGLVPSSRKRGSSPICSIVWIPRPPASFCSGNTTRTGPRWKRF
jgi:hypothetical protein